MGIQEIPRSFKYTCDRCGTDHTQENAGGHYSNSRPPKWSHLKLSRSAYDGDCAVGDKSVEYLLCPNCTENMADKITRAMTVANPIERG